MTTLLVCGAFLLAGQTADEKKILALVEELRTDDPAARRRALESLLDQAREAVPLAMRVLADEHPGLEEQVDGLVKKLASKEWKDRDAAQRELVKIGRHARARLGTHEASTDPEVSWRVKAALAEIDEREREASLAEYQRNTAICEFLGRAGDAKAVPLLLKLSEPPGQPNSALAEAQLALRVRAIEALGRLRAGLAEEDVHALADRAMELAAVSNDRRQANALLQTLGRLKSARVVKSMLLYVRDSSRRDVHLKRTALRAIAEIGDADGLAGIIRVLSSDDVYLRDGAIEVLAEAAGTDFGLDPRTPPAAAEAKIRAAQEWWVKKFGKAWTD